MGIIGEPENFNNLSESEQEIVATELWKDFGEDFMSQGVSEERAAYYMRQTYQVHNALLTAWTTDADGTRGILLATAGYVKLGEDVFVVNVWTNPERRGEGLAREIVAIAANAGAARHKKSHIKLWCEKELVPMYEKMGYRHLEQHRVSREKFVEIMVKRV